MLAGLSVIGELVSGMPLCEALARVEQQRALCECAQVKYSDKVEITSCGLVILVSHTCTLTALQDPLLWDISVAFPHLGLHLRFHPVSQVHSTTITQHE